MTKLQEYVLDLFHVMVLSEGQNKTTPVLINAPYGFVTDFNPAPSQAKVLKSKFQPLDGRTLFTVEERANADIENLITKQILHYVEVYGLGVEGVFNIPMSNERAMTMNYVRAVTVAELSEKVMKLLASNAPVATNDVPKIKEIVKHYAIELDLSEVKNNELKIALYTEDMVWTNGDDAVRYIVHKMTGRRPYRSATGPSTSCSTAVTAR